MEIESKIADFKVQLEQATKAEAEARMVKDQLNGAIQVLMILAAEAKNEEDAVAAAALNGAVDQGEANPEV